MQNSTALVERELCSENLDEEPTLQHELTFGRSYRVWKEADETSPITPKHSPINVPFKLCRAAQRKSHKHKKKKKRCKCSMKTLCTLQTTLTPQLSLLDRSALSQDKYMELLSIPNNYTKIKKRRKRRKKKIRVCCKCQIEPCPPRLIQMSIPNKRYVLQNWKDFEHILPAEMLLRFDQILKSGNNLDLRDARHYFKQLRRKRKKEIRRRKRLCRKKREFMKQIDSLWLKCQISKTADAIVCYIKQEPLFMLNYQQMMTSNELLSYLTSQRVVKVKSRNAKCVYKKTVIEISDKLVKWMDTMNFFADIQPLDSKEKLLEVPSLESLLEEESEEEEEEEEEESEGEEESEEEESEEGESEGEGEAGEGEGGRKRLKLGEDEEEWRKEMEGLLGEEGGGDAEEFIAEKLVDKTRLFDEYEGLGSLMDMLGDLDEDTLEKLIQILSTSPDDFLLEEIDDVNLPGVTYGDILEKLKEIRDGNLLEKKRDQIFLESKMIEWAKNNDPQRVDDKVLDTIHETATILSDWFKNADLSQFKKGPRDGEEWVGLDEQYGEDADKTLRPGVEETLEKTKDQGQLGASRPPFIEGEEEGEEYRTATGGEEEGEQGIDIDDIRNKEMEELAEMGEEGIDFDLDQMEMEGVDDLDTMNKPVTDADFGLDKELGEDFDDIEALEKQLEEEARLAREHGEFGDEFDEGMYGEEMIGKFEDEELGEGEAFGEGEGPFGEGEGPFGRPFEEGEGEEGPIKITDELERLDSLLGIIRGHKPPAVFEHEPGTICCLSLKIWAVWLLEIANNAHKWTKWIGDIIKQVRHYAAIIRGDVLLPNGEKQVLYKEEWRQFVKETEEKVIAWRGYSKHVKDLSYDIMDNFHGKSVKCCSKCLQDHLIKNVVTAHETLQALTEAINCAGYWQRCLDRIVEQTSKLTTIDMGPEPCPEDITSLASEGSYTIEIEELLHMPQTSKSEVSSESIYEIEEVTPSPRLRFSDYEVTEISPKRTITPNEYEIEEFPQSRPEVAKPPHEKHKKHDKTHAKPKKSNLKRKR